ncbi:hypothetical protein [Streptomyces sp. CB00316]|uniref:hypothetical protein n=1 Tax=Streptomyces sp. CB00316 TaxID=1703932 RepID=UPI001F398E86|nr:hypothetical protein [Streptomyces sp. CB00316]
MAGQRTARDVVVQAARELLSAQGLQEMPAGFGQDMSAGEVPTDGEDDRGDIDSGQHGVHMRSHPGPDRRPDRAAAVQEAVDHLLAELQHRG